MGPPSVEPGIGGREAEGHLPAGQPDVVGTQVFMANVVDQLKLDFDTAVSVHAPTPDRNYTKAEILKSLGRNN